jgi:hypothetical protein
MFKKVLLSFILATSVITSVAVADEHGRFYGGHHGWYHGSHGWWGPGPILAGVIIGGILMHDIDVNTVPPPDYERRVVCVPWTYYDQWGRQITEQQCHVEWVKVSPPVYTTSPPQPPQGQ